jgi:hypothetical protein
VSTADHAGRPVGPTSAGRGPYADGGNTGSGRSGGGGGSLRRLAGGDSSSTRSHEATRPMPSTGSDASTTSPLPKYPQGYTSRTGDDDAVAREHDRTSRREQAAQHGGGTQTAPQPTPTPTPTSTEHTAVAPAPETAPARRAEQRSSAPAPARPAPARRVRLTVSRVDPWSAMKLSFLLSVALGIAGVVMVAVLWTILEGMGVFDQVNGVIGQVIQDEGQSFDILDFIGFTRVVSLSIVIGVVDVILITAIATLGAFLYNVSSALVGGVQLTLTDD